MIGQTRRHRRSALPPGPVRGPGAKGPYRPTNVVAIKGKVRRRLVRLLALREAVGLQPVPRVAVPVGQVLPLQERHVDRVAHGRGRQRRGQQGGRTEDPPDNDLGHPPQPPDLVHAGVAQRRRRQPVRRVLRVPERRLRTRRLSPPRGPWSLRSGFRQKKRARSSLVGSGPCCPPKKANPKRLQNLQQRNRGPQVSLGQESTFSDSLPKTRRRTCSS
jgi:hypothetical protein